MQLKKKHSIPELSKAFTGMILLLFILFFAPTSSRDAQGQERQVLITSKGNQPITKGRYKTWSLFLISNPEWLLPEGSDKIAKLYEGFNAFGRAIGPDHLAVWFWSREPSGEDDFVGAVDVTRSSAFCTKLKLPPGKSPYVLITTEYPGEGLLSKYPESFLKPENYYLLELGDASASEITELLTELTNQIFTDRLSELEPKSEGFWRGLQRCFEASRDSIVGFSKKIKLTINTVFFTVEIATDPSHGE